MRGQRVVPELAGAYAVWFLVFLFPSSLHTMLFGVVCKSAFFAKDAKVKVQLWGWSFWQAVFFLLRKGVWSVEYWGWVVISILVMRVHILCSFLISETRKNNTAKTSLRGQNRYFFLVADNEFCFPRGFAFPILRPL